MSRLFLLAWRNVVRQRRRTLFALASLIVGLAGLVVFQGYISRTMAGFRDSTIHGGLGHLQIAATEKYYAEGEFNPFAFALPDAAGLARSIASIRGVTAVFPSTGFTAIAGFGDKSVTLLVKGYPSERMRFGTAADRAIDPDTFDLGPLSSGSEIAVGDRNGIVLGDTAARILGARPGDVVTLMAILPDGGLEGRDFTVKGTYAGPGRDRIFAFTDYDSAMDFTHQTAPPLLHIFLDNAEFAGPLAGELAPKGAVRTWRDLATYYVQVNSMFRGFLDVIRAIILIITLFVLGNAMNRIVFERMAEWGTLRAMGTTRRDLLVLLLFEGLLIGVVGAVVGIGAGFGVSGLLDLFGGIPFSDGGSRFLIKVVPDPGSA